MDSSAPFLQRVSVPTIFMCLVQLLSWARSAVLTFIRGHSFVEAVQSRLACLVRLVLPGRTFGAAASVHGDLAVPLDVAAAAQDEEMLLGFAAQPDRNASCPWKSPLCGAAASSLASSTSAPSSPSGGLLSPSQSSSRSSRQCPTMSPPGGDIELPVADDMSSDEGDAEGSCPEEEEVAAPAAAADGTSVVGKHITRDNLRLSRCFTDLAEVPPGRIEAQDLVMRAVQLLRSCGFQTFELCEVLAHASAYNLDVTRAFGEVQASECGYILMLLVFIAHSYVDDEHCPLRIWHKYLFANYCDMPTLNTAVMLLLKTRDHKLRVPPDEVERRYRRLLESVDTAADKGCRPMFPTQSAWDVPTMSSLREQPCLA
eukprot:TRINITY_DN110971_c0_g1_i1.p1 TRINITY_DN110971_c0_g1~~TRINITY_DN110971_c0_g1_i1.p1  ORF type:complete len:371 (+),score=62.94 TRINITY_DN110971_c0_g1_i1:57-1169(+)